MSNQGKKSPKLLDLKIEAITRFMIICHKNFTREIVFWKDDFIPAIPSHMTLNMVAE